MQDNKIETVVAPATEENLSRAGALIRAGELVGFPTETVYGLGADALCGEAVQKIFRAKGRPGDNPLIVHIANLSEIDELILGSVPETAKRLAEAYWPGPLTMILPKSERVPLEVSAGLSTVGIRMPAHPAARALIGQARRPIAAPSANRSGRPSPTTAEHVRADMDGRVPLILDGGPCAVGLESTVLDLTCDPPRVLRPGGVTPQMIAKIAGAVEVDGSVLRPLKAGEIARSPGMKYRHYAPKGQLTIVRGARVLETLSALYDEAVARGERACILAKRPEAFGARETRALGENPDEAAARIFALLREMDDLGVEAIFAEGIEAEGLGLAVMNRMGRAAAFHVVEGA